MYLNNKLVSSDSDLYPYRAYIENLLSYSKDCQDTQLKAFELWDKDTATHMQDNTARGANGDRKGRRARIQGRVHLANSSDDYIKICSCKKNIFLMALNSDSNSTGRLTTFALWVLLKAKW
jgi:hypothetical protein